MKATATAGSNIAFVKYWGNLDDQLRLPMNGSISMTLANAFTTTTVELGGQYPEDTLWMNDQLAGPAATQRASKQLNYLREIAGINHKAKIVSRNSFPTGAGIASSASGLAALTVSAAGALGLTLSAVELSRLSRLGSGSACRSVDGGFVEWYAGARHEDSFAVQIAPPEHWDLVDVIAIVSAEEKEVGSTAGHPLAHTSPFYQARLGELQKTLPLMRKAIFERDLALFGELLEAEAISLHVASMTSKPSIFYWTGGTMTILNALRRWRAAGEAVGYFTIDAGPNVHILTQKSEVPAVLAKLKELPVVSQTLVCPAGEGAKLVEGHLF